MDNPFDVFDSETPSETPVASASGVNPFDQFDAEIAPEAPAIPDRFKNWDIVKMTDKTDEFGDNIPMIKRSTYRDYKERGLFSDRPTDPTFQQFHIVDDDYDPEEAAKEAAFKEQLELPENEALKKALTPGAKREGEIVGKRQINEFLDGVIEEKFTPSPIADLGIDVAAGLGQVAVNPIDAVKGVVKSVAGIPKNAFNAVKSQNAANKALDAIPENATIEERQAGLDAYDENREKAMKGLVDTGVGGLNAFTLGRGGKAAKQAMKDGGVKAAVSKIKPTPSQKKAMKTIYAQAKRAGKSKADVDAAIAKAKASGDTTTFWQALDLDDAATAISTKGGAPAKVIETQAAKEIAEQGPKVSAAFSKALKDPKVTMSPSRVEAEFKRQGRKNYQEAYKVEFRPSENMSKLLSDMRMQDRLAAAEKATMKAGNAGKASQTEILHSVKKTLDDDISELFRKGRGNEAQGLKDNYLTPLLKELDKANPQYAKARKFYADGNASKRATELGEKVLRIDEDDFADAVKGMAASEKASLQNGVMRSIRKQMDNPESYNSVRKQFRNPSFKRKLEKIMPAKDVDELIKALDDEGLKFARNSRVNAKTNSATASRQQAVKALDDDLRGPVRKVGSGAAMVATETRRSVVGALEKVFGKGSDRIIRRLDDKTTRTMADIMAKPIKDAPDIFNAMPANRRKKFVKALGQTGASDKKTLAKKIAILTAIEQADGALKKEIDAARRAMNDNFEEPKKQAAASR